MLNRKGQTEWTWREWKGACLEQLTSLHIPVLIRNKWRDIFACPLLSYLSLGIMLTMRKTLSYEAATWKRYVKRKRLTCEHHQTQFTSFTYVHKHTDKHKPNLPRSYRSTLLLSSLIDTKSHTHKHTHTQKNLKIIQHPSQRDRKNRFFLFYPYLVLRLSHRSVVLSYIHDLFLCSFAIKRSIQSSDKNGETVQKNVTNERNTRRSRRTTQCYFLFSPLLVIIAFPEKKIWFRLWFYFD